MDVTFFESKLIFFLKMQVHPYCHLIISLVWVMVKKQVLKIQNSLSTLGEIKTKGKRPKLLCNANNLNQDMTQTKLLF